MLAVVAAASLLKAPPQPGAPADPLTLARAVETLGAPRLGTSDTAAASDQLGSPTEGTAAEAPGSPAAVTASEPLGSPPAVLLMPVEGVSVADVRPSFGDPRDGGSRSHAGIDIAAPRGTPVRPAAVGTVWRADGSPNAGLAVTVIGEDGVRYFYAHLDAVAEGIERGARVGVDTVIGYVGNTGNAAATAPHLHFEVALPAKGGERSWTPVDPLPLLTDRSPPYP